MKAQEKIPDLTNREFLSPFELAQEKWFPINSTATIYSMIKNGKLKAYNVSLVESKGRYKIPKEEVIKFMVGLDETSKD